MKNQKIRKPLRIGDLAAFARKPDTAGIAAGESYPDAGNLTSENQEDDQNTNIAGLVLTEGEKALLDDPNDPIGRVSDARAAKMLGQAIFRTPELTWSPALVKQRLKQAMRGIEAYVGQPGPAGRTGFWPATAKEFTDQVAMMQTGELDRFMAAKSSVREGMTEREIGRIEQAIVWPARYLREREQWAERRALQCWLWCQAKRRPFSDQYKELGCPKRTADRRVDRAIEIILAGLLKDGVLP